MKIRAVDSAEELARLAAEGRLEGAYAMPAELYHGGPGVSRSILDAVALSPAHCRSIREHGIQVTDAMRFGTAFHFALLEPDEFERRYVRGIPEEEKLDGRTREGKVQRAEFEALAVGREILSDGDWRSIQGMLAAVHANDIARELLSVGTRETTLYWERRGPQGPILCKARPDHMRPDGIVVDIKSAEDASPAAFAKATANRRYHCQAPFYLEGAARVSGREFNKFIFIVVEKKPIGKVAGAPHAVGIYLASDATVARGRELIERDLAVYQACEAANRWPCFSDGVIHDLNLPAFAFYD